jgi:glycerophosphoryl diester phosphodiesterase
MEIPRPVEVIAHRGFSAAAPENTLAAFAAAIACGADRIEFDVQLTADGVAVVIHDDDLDRTTDGKGPVGGRRLDEIVGLDAGAWFGAEFRGTRVPTLDETLALARERIAVNVEIKAGARVSSLAEAVVALLARHRLLGTAIVSSFDPQAIAGARRLHEDLRLEILHDDASRPPGPDDLDRALRLGASGFSVSREEIAAVPWLPGEAHARGLGLKVYTVDDPAEAVRLAALGVDGIFTNRPDALLKVLRRR